MDKTSKIHITFLLKTNTMNKWKLLHYYYYYTDNKITTQRSKTLTIAKTVFIK